MNMGTDTGRCIDLIAGDLGVTDWLSYPHNPFQEVQDEVISWQWGREGETILDIWGRRKTFARVVSEWDKEENLLDMCGENCRAVLSGIHSFV